MTLRVLEHYTSVQGEGPRTGLPTQFVRFAGCNLRCAKWPCDTPYSIEPKLYRKEQRLVAVPQLVEEIHEEHRRTGADNICFTGGEPMLQTGKDLNELIIQLTSLNNTVAWQLEMFSNGTLPYNDVVLECVNVVMDWKLPGSGEDPHNMQRIQNYHAMADIDGHTVKFTCADRYDLEYALRMYHDHNMNSFQGQIYCGPVWFDSSHTLAGGTPVGVLTAAEIVEFILGNQLPWKLNLQLHKYVWDPDARRT